jgi:hypothetical protein
VRPSPTPTGEASGLWYELGRLYAAAGEDRRRTVREGFVVAFVTAALVLLSAPLFGTSWAGPVAALIPVATGLLFGGGSLGWRRAKFFERREALRRALGAGRGSGETGGERSRRLTTTPSSFCCVASTSS